MNNANIYQEELINHYRRPRNLGRLENPDLNSGSFNPSCGDAVGFDAYISEGAIKEIKFYGHGCVISQATASMLTEKCKSMSLDIATKLKKEDIITMISIDLGPTRLRCALLSLEALQNGIKEYQNKNLN